MTFLKIRKNQNADVKFFARVLFYMLVVLCIWEFWLGSALDLSFNDRLS